MFVWGVVSVLTLELSLARAQATAFTDRTRTSLEVRRGRSQKPRSVGARFAVRTLDGMLTRFCYGVWTRPGERCGLVSFSVFVTLHCKSTEREKGSRDGTRHDYQTRTTTERLGRRSCCGVCWGILARNPAQGFRHVQAGQRLDHGRELCERAGHVLGEAVLARGRGGGARVANDDNLVGVAEGARDLGGDLQDARTRTCTHDLA